MFLFWLHQLVLPGFKRMAEEHEQLTQRLGREPTERELLEHFGIAYER